MSDNNAKVRTVNVTLKTHSMTDEQYQMVEDVIDSWMDMLFSLKWITDAEVDLNLDKKEFDVHYEERYCKRVSAVDGAEAAQLVLRDRLGSTIYFDTALQSVKEADDQG